MTDFPQPTYLGTIKHLRDIFQVLFYYKYKIEVKDMDQPFPLTILQ